MKDVSANWVTCHGNKVNELTADKIVKKAPGHDRISNKILKHLPNSTIAYINNIFNSIIRTGYFPIIRKNSNVIPIAKPFKNLNNTDSYRPISLLPTLSKILVNVQHQQDQEKIDPTNNTHHLHHGDQPLHC